MRCWYTARRQLVRSVPGQIQGGLTATATAAAAAVAGAR